MYTNRKRIVHIINIIVKSSVFYSCAKYIAVILYNL